MNKSELLEYLSSKYNHLPLREVEKMFEKIINIFSEALSKNNRIEIRGFGSFAIKKRDERVARNPRNGKSVMVPKKKLISFRASKDLRKLLNEE